MHRFFYAQSLWLFGGLAVAACSNVPTFPQYGPDAAVECGQEGLTCPSGQVCLDSRCYPSCTTAGCGPLESCVGGICVPFGGDAGSDGGTDAPPDPCAGVMCDVDTPYCRGGTCYVCTLDESACGGGTPICRVSRNDCVAFAAGSACEPCNTIADCTGGATCEVLGVLAPERVCLMPCSPACPNGFTCDTASSTCRPASGASCFQHLAAISGLACTLDADCAPNGASFAEGLFTGSCDLTTGTCRFPCGVPTDCVSGVCDAVSGFCM